MKTVPIEVFILENGQYVSITNNEHELRKATDPEYAKRSFYPIQGRLMEVSKQDYDELYRADERMRYVMAVEIKKGQLSLDAFFDDEDDEATDFIPCDDEDIAEQVADKLLREEVRRIVLLLPSDEQELINALFFKGYSERQWSKISGIPQKTINDRKQKILLKMKKILKN